MIFKKLVKSVNTRPKAEFVRKALDKGVVLLDKERIHVRSGFFNVSNLGYCLRQIYFQHTDAVSAPPGLLKKFGAGVDAGQRIVRMLRKADILFGSYVCSGCHSTGTLCDIPSRRCCEQGDFIYSELSIRNTERKISGKVDLFVRYNNKVILGEVKSASTYYKLMDKKNIEKKLGHNVQQANMYVGMIRSHLRAVEKGRKSPFLFTDVETGTVLCGSRLGKQMDTSSFLMIYEDKNSNENYVHEFPYDHDMYLKDLEHVKVFYQYVDEKRRPPKPEDTSKCKYCDYIERCNEKEKK